LRVLRIKKKAARIGGFFVGVNYKNA